MPVFRLLLTPIAMWRPAYKRLPPFALTRLSPQGIISVKMRRLKKLVSYPLAILGYVCLLRR
jgi:hypothetical protein